MLLYAPLRNRVASDQVIVLIIVPIPLLTCFFEREFRLSEFEVDCVMDLKGPSLPVVVTWWIDFYQLHEVAFAGRTTRDSIDPFRKHGGIH